MGGNPLLITLATMAKDIVAVCHRNLEPPFAQVWIDRFKLVIGHLDLYFNEWLTAKKQF